MTPDAPHSPENTERGDCEYNESDDRLKNPEMVRRLVREPVRVMVQRQPALRGIRIVRPTLRLVQANHVITNPFCSVAPQHSPSRADEPATHKQAPARPYAPECDCVDCASRKIAEH